MAQQPMTSQLKAALLRPAKQRGVWVVAINQLRRWWSTGTQHPGWECKMPWISLIAAMTQCDAKNYWCWA